MGTVLPCYWFWCLHTDGHGVWGLKEIRKSPQEIIMHPFPYCRALNHRKRDLFCLCAIPVFPERGCPRCAEKIFRTSPAELSPPMGHCGSGSPQHRAPRHNLFLNVLLQSNVGSRDGAGPATTGLLAWTGVCLCSLTERKVPSGRLIFSCGYWNTHPALCFASQTTKSRWESASYCLPVLETNRIFSMNFREAKISSVLFRISPHKADSGTHKWKQNQKPSPPPTKKTQPQPYQFSKEDTEILHPIYISDNEHMCNNTLLGSFFSLSITIAQCNLPDNSCCQRRLWDLSCAWY